MIIVRSLPFAVLSVSCVQPPGSPSTASGTTGATTPAAPYVCDGTPRAPSGMVAQGDIGDLWLVVQGNYMLAVGSPGDMNGDGCEDLIASTEDGLHLFLGPLGRGTWTTDEADATLPWPDEATRAMNDSIMPAGDVDHDGRDEVFAAERLVTYDGQALAVMAELVGSGPETRIAGGFDADGDGELDALVPSDGESMLVYGPLQSWGRIELFPADPIPLVDLARLEDPSGRDYRASVAWVGDLDGDGVGEVLAGDNRPGHAWIYRTGDLRGQALTQADAWPAEPFGHDSGYRVRVTPDVDGDGVADFTTDAGLFSGAEIASEAPEPLLSVIAGEEGARRLAPLGGDVDGDGVGDLLLQEGERYWVLSGTSRGTANVDVLPEPGSELSTAGGSRGYVLMPSAIGYDVIGQAGDITGDGRVDLLGRDIEHGEAFVWASDDVSTNRVAN